MHKKVGKKTPSVLNNIPIHLVKHSEKLDQSNIKKNLINGKQIKKGI